MEVTLRDIGLAVLLASVDIQSLAASKIPHQYHILYSTRMQDLYLKP